MNHQSMADSYAGDDCGNHEKGAYPCTVNGSIGSCDSSPHFGTLFFDVLMLPFAVLASLKSLVAPRPAPTGAAARCNTCGCDIRPAPGEPVSLGELVTILTPGSMASVSLRISNSSAASHTFHTSLQPMADSHLERVTTPELVLGPFERGSVSAQIIVPPNATVGTVLDRVVLVKGSTTYVLRWVLKVGFVRLGLHQCVDLIDYVSRPHLWSDHFQC